MVHNRKWNPIRRDFCFRFKDKKKYNLNVRSLIPVARHPELKKLAVAFRDADRMGHSKDSWKEETPEIIQKAIEKIGQKWKLGEAHGAPA